LAPNINAGKIEISINCGARADRENKNGLKAIVVHAVFYIRERVEPDILRARKRYFSLGIKTQSARLLSVIELG
jgi:hypothetical protein